MNIQLNVHERSINITCLVLYVSLSSRHIWRVNYIFTRS